MRVTVLCAQLSEMCCPQYLVAVAIDDEIAAEVTAMAMGWEPVESEDGTTIWVRSKDIGVDGAPYCYTALEVVRSYTH